LSGVYFGKDVQIPGEGNPSTCIIGKCRQKSRSGLKALSRTESAPMIRLEMSHALLTSLVAACTCEALPMIRLDTFLTYFYHTSHFFLIIFLLLASSASPFKIIDPKTKLHETSSNQATCIVGGLVHVRTFSYLHHWGAN
jgi:F0F1-type ATP synthase assembly protein I